MSIPFRIRRAEWIAGAFVLLAGAAILVALLLTTLATDSLSDRVIYHARIEHAYGITAGSRVDMLGIEIGRVDNVRITDDNQVELELDIRGDYAHKIGTDSEGRIKASFGLQGVLAGVVLTISPGSSGAELEHGGNIPVREPERFSDLVPGEAKDPLLDDLETLAHNLREVSDEATSPDGRLLQIATDVGKLVARLERGEGTAGKLIADDEQLYDRLLGTLEKLDATVTRADKLLQRSERMVGRGGGVMTKADGVMQSADGLVASADDLIESADAVVDKTGPVLDNTNDAMKEMKGAMKNFSDATKELSAVVVELDDLVAEIRILTDAASHVYPIRRHIDKARRDHQRSSSTRQEPRERRPQGRGDP